MTPSSILTPDQQTRLATRLRADYGPWAVVTGASDGIGRALAEEIARVGLDVVVVARRKERLEELASGLRSRHGVRTQIVVADLGTPSGIEAVETATRALDVGLFAACAGFGTSGALLGGDLDTELNMLDVNCAALLRGTHHFGRRMVARGRGGLILMSSLVGFQGVPQAAHYAATKAYVQSLAEGLSIELRAKGVDVMACAPGPVASGFAERANMQMGSPPKPEDIAPAILRGLGRRTTLRPGLLAKFLELSLSLLPRWGRVRVMSRVMGGMTAHQIV